MEPRITKVVESINDLRKDIMDVISQVDKDITIEYGGETFYFHQVFTEEEYKNMQWDRKRFVDIIMVDCIAHYIGSDNDKSFDIIKSLFSGPNPKDFKLERINDEDIYNVSAVDGESKRSAPLDTETVYVQSQRSDLDFEDKSVVDSFIEKHSTRLKERNETGIKQD